MQCIARPTRQTAPRRAAVKGACARPPQGVDGHPSGASIEGRSEALPADAESSSLDAAPTARQPAPPPLASKRSVGVLDPVAQAEALDVGDGSVPDLLLGRVARPFPQLRLDVG